ncbi:MAG: DUF86 domain-containing protein [Balneolaceae bacterium]|nr:DUF86 domain-containing protein [Balneolaceae bacterium]
MVDRDVAFAKISSIQRCLKRISDITQLDPESLNDLDVQEIMILNLQRAVQSSIDLASHIVADEGLGLPQELRENFDILLKNDILPKDLTLRLRKMVGFRNIAVHEYESINPDILKSILKNNLRDFEEYYTAIIRHYNLSG